MTVIARNVLAVAVGSVFVTLWMIHSATSPTGALEAARSRADQQLCAYIEYGDSCGFAGSGRRAYVRNRRNDSRVRATVETRWRYRLESGTSEREHVVPAGGRTSLGCTVSNSVPTTNRNFRVIGCVILEGE